MKKNSFPPLIYNVFKPTRQTSYDVIRHFKRNLPTGFGKIGHFGTLDPFAAGVLMIGTGGAARLNELIHEHLPKTYLAVGKLGIETPTGDYTSEIIQRDESVYLNREIASFSLEFLNERFKGKFVGDYWQAPHKYSASKFMGKNMHEWAREGIEVKKEPVLRKIYQLEVVKYKFPYVAVRVTVSSGTYVRTLFTDMAHDLGTLGSLISLVRESVGEVSTKTALHLKNWPEGRIPEYVKNGMRVDHVLPFTRIILDEAQTKKFRNGAFFKMSDFELKPSPIGDGHFWMVDEADELIGLAINHENREIRPRINFSDLHSEDEV